jgi:D-alanyl-D-alanine carboxypeptidase
MLLVEDRKLRVDDRLTNFFGWLPKEWGEVTVRHLLTHTSGIREQEWNAGIIEFDRFEQNQEEIVRTAFGPMLAPPGERFIYSNVSYRLLGMLIEKVSGQSYWDFLEQRIFRRVGMEVTRNSDPKTVIPNRARGYGISDGKHVNREPVTASSAFAQGALISSVLDMVKWDAALSSEALLKKTSLDQMWTPV